MFNVVAIVWAAVLWAMGFGAATRWRWAGRSGTLLGGAGAVPGPGAAAAAARAGASGPEWAPGDPGPARDRARSWRPATVGLAAVQVNIFVSTHLRLARARGGLLAAVRVPHPLPADRRLRRGGRHDRHHRPRAARGRGRHRGHARDAAPVALRMLAFLTLPATVGPDRRWACRSCGCCSSAAGSRPPTRERTAAALAALRVGLVGLHGREGAGARLLRARHAARAARWPARSPSPRTSSVILALHGALGFRAIALGTALGSIVNASLLAGRVRAARRRARRPRPAAAGAADGPGGGGDGRFGLRPRPRWLETRLGPRASSRSSPPGSCPSRSGSCSTWRSRARSGWGRPTCSSGSSAAASDGLSDAPTPRPIRDPRAREPGRCARIPSRPGSTTCAWSAASRPTRSWPTTRDLAALAPSPPGASRDAARAAAGRPRRLHRRRCAARGLSARGRWRAPCTPCAASTASRCARAGSTPTPWRT